MFSSAAEPPPIRFSIDPACRVFWMRLSPPKVRILTSTRCWCRSTRTFLRKKRRSSIRRWKRLQVYTREQMEGILVGKLIATSAKQIGMFLVILAIVSAAIIAFIIFTLTLGKIREIAVLKLIGTRNRTIAWMILQQSLALGMIGFVVGKGDTAVDALKGVDMHVFPGEVVGLIGPSGSGKSTLLKCLGAVIEPTAGRMTLGSEVIYDNGWKIPDLRALRRDKIGFVFQAPYLIPFLDVTDNVALLPMLAGRSNAESRKRAL